MAVKLSKSAKDRIKRMHKQDQKMISKYAMVLADNDIISHGRWQAVIRAINSSYKQG